MVLGSLNSRQVSYFGVDLNGVQLGPRTWTGPTAPVNR